MNYCGVMSVGYGIAAGGLWLIVSLTLSVVYPLTTSLAFLSLSLPIAFSTILLGTTLNCIFETLGQHFSLDPHTSILLGWLTLGLIGALFGLSQSPPPATLEGIANAVYRTGTESLSNSFLSSDIFYKIGNLTLSALGLG